jgi:hypothetical protein
MYYIYAHYTEDTNELFYIGVGQGGRANTISGRNEYWSRIYKKHGRTVSIFPHRYNSREIAVQREVTLQVLLRPRACLIYGEYGNSSHTEESKKKMRKPKSKVHYGRPCSDHTKKRTSEENSKPVINCRGIIFDSAKLAADSIGQEKSSVARAARGLVKTSGTYSDGTRIRWNYIQKER